MYLAVRYEGGKHSLTGHSGLNLILRNDQQKIIASLSKRNESVAYMGYLNTILQWHREDPVDYKEIYRNDVVYSYQGNRNPFIDHPEYATCLFESNC